MAPVDNSLRPEVKQADIAKGLEDLKEKLLHRLTTKGFGAYASRHEVYGILAEEMDEALDELRINTADGYSDFKKELLDVAVGALFGYICLNGGYIAKKKKG